MSIVTPDAIKELNPVFIQIAEDAVQKALEKHNTPLDEWNYSDSLKLMAIQLQIDFEELYKIWVAEDDDYVHVDEAYEYVCNDPPEGDPNG